jgi:hypothetical protein
MSEEEAKKKSKFVTGDRLKLIPNKPEPNLLNILREDLKTKQKNTTR